MRGDDTIDCESERFGTAECRTNRRQWLSFLGTTGLVPFVPVATAATQDGDGDELFRDTIDNSGGGVGVSETGNIIAFGEYAGTVHAYRTAEDDANEYAAIEFQLSGVEDGFAVSHVFVTEETNEIVTAAMDADIVGGGTLDDGGGSLDASSTDAAWAYEQPGLWDVSTSADLSTVATVSDPLDTTPHVAVVTDGEVAWEQPITDATGRAVDVSDDGQYVAVGSGYQIGEDVGLTGQPDISVYANDGDLLWSHETAEDVISIGVNTEAGVVVAGINDSSTLAFDLEGEALWERDESPTMTALSGDGETVLADPPVVGLDATDGTVRWESEVHEVNLLADPLAPSHDGSRVAVSTFDFELVALEEGEPVWEAQNEDGPFYSALSADGTTLAAIWVDNDAQETDLVGYRIDGENDN